MIFSAFASSWNSSFVLLELNSFNRESVLLDLKNFDIQQTIIQTVNMLEGTAAFVGSDDLFGNGQAQSGSLFIFTSREIRFVKTVKHLTFLEAYSDTARD